MKILKELISSITESLTSQWLIPLLSSLSSIVILVIPQFQIWIDQLIPISMQGRLAAILIILLCIAVAYIYHLRKELYKPSKDFLEDFEFVDYLGLYKHKMKTGYFCGSCTPNKVISPLFIEPHGWRCQIKNCNKFHQNPDNPIKYIKNRRQW